MNNIKSYCPNKILFKIVIASNDKDYVNYLKTINLDKDIKIGNPSWEYENHYNTNGYKYITRWNWWSYISGFWNLDVDNNISSAIEDGTETLGDLIEIIDEGIDEIPVIGIAVEGVAAALLAESTIWKAHEYGNGIYQDFEIIVPIPFAVYGSDVEWNKI